MTVSRVHSSSQLTRDPGRGVIGLPESELGLRKSELVPEPAPAGGVFWLAMDRQH
jgi:hypothetical protein